MPASLREVPVTDGRHAGRRRARSLGCVALAASLVAAAACTRAGDAPAATASGGTATPQRAATTRVREVPARAVPYRTAEVRARVSGIVQKRLFAEGAEVEEGQLLFRIDPARYEAAYDAARAMLAQAEARAASARLLAERHDELARSPGAAGPDHDAAVAARAEAEADLEAARAVTARACIDLGYTAVTAPLAGRVGRAAVVEGAYARQGQATLLATVQQLDPMYVEATLASADAARLRADLDAGLLPRTGSGAVRVTLVLEDGREYGEPGTVQLSDVAVDPGTGSVTVRAVFPNPRRELVPGASVRARVEALAAPGASAAHRLTAKP